MPNSVFPHSPITAPSAVPAALSWALATLAAGAALGAGWCFLDAIWSPLIVLPALVGASLGLASTAALSFAPTSSRAWAAGVTFAGSALTALVFHYVSYQRARADFDDARERLLTKGGLAG
ncbi:MAG TPA: hypothetical protein VGE52_12400, partial [Pirellulales bacterium]